MPLPPNATTAGARQVCVFSSLDEMLDEATMRRPFRTADGLSGSRFESLMYQGERMILKSVSVDDDWIMRASGDLDCRQLTLFESGLLERLPLSIDHATVAVAPFVSPSGHRGGAFLMKDVSASMVPPGSTRIELDQHLRFLDHMSELHAAYWGRDDAGGLFPAAHHYVMLTPLMAAIERARGSRDIVPPAVAEGWESMRSRWPSTHAALLELALEPGPLTTALAATPQTFSHADWKLGNLGEHRDGRTVLLDWDRCGTAPATFDIAWYLAVNCDRIPQSKEKAIDAYRSALEKRGVDVGGWWERQLALTLLGAFLMLAWSKTHDPVEFAWWEARMAAGLQHL